MFTNFTDAKVIKKTKEYMISFIFSMKTNIYEI